MGYQDLPSDFTSSDRNSAWWLYRYGDNQQFACNSSGYEIALFLTNFMNPLLRRQTVRDWRGQRIAASTGPISFSSTMQRFLWAIAPNGMRPMIRAEAEASQFGLTTLRAALKVLTEQGRPTLNGASGASSSTYVSDWTPEWDPFSFPDETILPSLNQSIPVVSGSPRTAVCVVLTQPVSGQGTLGTPSPTPVNERDELNIPDPVIQEQRTQEAFQSTPSEPIPDSTVKVPSGNKTVAVTQEDQPSLPETQQTGSFDAQGNYIPSMDEQIMLVPLQPNIVNTGAQVPPPSVRMMSDTSSSPSTMILGVAALGVLAAYLLAQQSSSSSYSEVTGPTQPEPAPAEDQESAEPLRRAPVRRSSRKATRRTSRRR